MLQRFQLSKTTQTMNYLESCQTGFTSRCGITRVAFSILATATASHILEQRKGRGKRKIFKTISQHKAKKKKKN